jgi:hypothetical protein
MAGKSTTIPDRTRAPYPHTPDADHLPPQIEAQYTSIIDNILATSDLNTISAKRIRKGLQEALHQDISQQKVGTYAII